ncbi:hypothetical protein [Streptomyces sp. SID12501]|uniref:Uncharacterized protein n=1 Tax=Streptomyces sp. SID12501 TaxID=2706042 RepID=A0A6B3BQL6_9ACTN|nr:hypothetical protein [Streptomyces sp. SID12501]NEC86647.1 hypothetical protein [Streptomyces sp. SID12501]
MAERSAAALRWLLAPLVLWGITRLLPPTGTHRMAPTAIRTFMTSKNSRDHVSLPARVPAQRRSPYSTDQALLDGSASPLSRPYLPELVEYAPEAVTTLRTAPVRPYWTAREPMARWRRRRVLVLAAHFPLDLDTRNIRTAPAVGDVR